MIKFICPKCNNEIERYHDESENNHLCKPTPPRTSQEAQEKAEQIVESTRSMALPTGDTSTLVSAIATALQQLMDERERLRKQNKESSDNWTKRTAQMESDLAELRQLMLEGAKILRPEMDGLHFSAYQQGAVADLLKKIAAQAAEIAELKEVMERVEDMLDIAIVDKSTSLRKHTAIECQRQLRTALGSHKQGGAVDEPGAGA